MTWPEKVLLVIVLWVVVVAMVNDHKAAYRAGYRVGYKAALHKHYQDTETWWHRVGSNRPVPRHPSRNPKPKGSE